MKKTVAFISKLLKEHYPKKYLPRWVIAEPFYDDMSLELALRILDMVEDSQVVVNLETFMYAFVSIQTSVRDDDADMPEIPDKVIEELEPFTRETFPKEKFLSEFRKKHRL